MRTEQAPDTAPRCNARQQGGAFSLLELLVAIAIIGLLLTITIPAIRLVREAARHASVQSALRQHATAMTAYAGDNADVLPRFGEAAIGLFIEAEGRGDVGDYFSQFEWWHTRLAKPYYDLSASDPLFYDPRVRGRDDWTTHGSWAWTDYRYPCVFVATPEYWRSETRRGETQFRGQRLSDVAYASDKVLLVIHGPPDPKTPGLPGDVRLATVAGSVMTARPDERVPGLGTGCGYGLFSTIGATHPFDTPWGLHTLDGVRGRDLRRRE